MTRYRHGYVWDDLMVPGTAALNNPSAGVRQPSLAKWLDDGAGSPGIYLYQFSNTQEQDVFFAVQMPHSKLENSYVSPHVHWAPTTAVAAKAVQWGMEYSWQNINGVFPASKIVYALGATDNVANKHMLSEFADITLAGYSLSSFFVGRLFRDVGVANNYGAAIVLLGFDLHIRKDTNGSQDEYLKFG